MKRIIQYQLFPWIEGVEIKPHELHIKVNAGHIEYAAINPKGDKVNGVLSEKNLGLPIPPGSEFKDIVPFKNAVLRATARKGVTYDPVLFFIYPFATSGDRAAVPNSPPMDGTMSYQEGYTPPYEGDYPTDPTADPILRTQMNQVLYDITNGIQQYQIAGFPEFITTSDNGGSPFPYDIYAIVRYNPGSGIQLYQSIVGSNTTLPTNTTHWRQISNITNQSQFAILSFQSGTTQDVPGSADVPVIVALDDIITDPSSLVTGASGSYGFKPSAGWWRFDGMVWGQTSVGNTCNFCLLKNGVFLTNFDYFASGLSLSSGGPQMRGQSLELANGTDVFNLAVATVGTTITLQNGPLSASSTKYTRFNCQFVSF